MSFKEIWSQKNRCLLYCIKIYQAILGRNRLGRFIYSLVKFIYILDLREALNLTFAFFDRNEVLAFSSNLVTPGKSHLNRTFPGACHFNGAPNWQRKKRTEGSWLNGKCCQQCSPSVLETHSISNDCCDWSIKRDRERFRQSKFEFHLLIAWVTPTGNDARHIAVFLVRSYEILPNRLNFISTV